MKETDKKIKMYLILPQEVEYQNNFASFLLLIKLWKIFLSPSEDV